jgi:AcrR family transcriptional regulator
VIEPTARDARRKSQARRFITLARAWTLERGLDGFTLEDLASAAGASRRTFFNYFPSKEHAVLGLQAEQRSEVEESAFVDGRLLGGGSALVDELAELVMRRAERLVPSAEDYRQLLAVVRAVPRLQHRMSSVLAERAEADVRLVEQREHLSLGDPRAQVVVRLVYLLLDQVIAERLQGTATGPFREHFASHLEFARALFDRSSKEAQR